MKKMLLVLALAMVSILITGCNKQPKVAENINTEEPVLKFSIPAKEMKIYVDNSLDINVQEGMVDAYVNALNDVDGFKAEVSPGYIGKTDWELLEFDLTYPERDDGRIYTYDTNLNYPKFTTLRHINTYNHKFNDKIQLFDEDHGVFFSNVKYYEDRKYTAKKVDAKSFEIFGFNSKKEAVDIYIQLLRDGYEFKVNPLRKRLWKELSNRPLNTFYNGTGLKFDGEALEKEGRLIIVPRIMDFSMKDNLITLLKHNGLTVVNDPKDANLVIIVHNLLFEAKRHVAKPGMENVIAMLKNDKIKLPHEKYKVASSLTQTGTNLVQAGHAKAGYAGLALGALALLDSSSISHLYNIQLVSYYENGENIFSGIETNITIPRTPGTRALNKFELDFTNYNIADNIIEDIHKAR